MKKTLVVFKKSNLLLFVQFEWDENKAASNYAKHGILFSEAVHVFEDPHKVSFVDNRRDYGEIRELTVGKIDDKICMTVVSTDRKGICRLISARLANKKERMKYHG